MITFFFVNIFLKKNLFRVIKIAQQVEVFATNLMT